MNLGELIEAANAYEAARRAMEEARTEMSRMRDEHTRAYQALDAAGAECEAARNRLLLVAGGAWNESAVRDAGVVREVLQPPHGDPVASDEAITMRKRGA